jgi:hypothetical protein
MYKIDEKDRIVTLHGFPFPGRYEPFLAHGDVSLSFAYAVAKSVVLPQDIPVPLLPDALQPLNIKMSWKGGWQAELPEDWQEHVPEGWNIDPREARKKGMHLFASIKVSGNPGHIYMSYDYAKKYPPFIAHPLASRGLFPNSVFLVENSSWLRHLRSLMPDEFPTTKFDHFDASGQGIHEVECIYRHFLFTFTTATLEFITEYLDCQFVWAFSSDMQAEVGMTKWLMW